LLVDRETRDALSADAFKCEEAGAFALKGFTDDVPLYRVSRGG
jgi:class 3 adenylate cyclase